MPMTTAVEIVSLTLRLIGASGSLVITAPFPTDEVNEEPNELTAVTLA